MLTDKYIAFSVVLAILNLSQNLKSSGIRDSSSLTCKEAVSSDGG